jgi:ArsR family transcriptional regulator, arsenate/arsenite/antimonite-responsive transcriptional repressor
LAGSQRAGVFRVPAPQYSTVTPSQKISFDSGLYFDIIRNMKTRRTADKRNEYFAGMLKALGSDPRLRVIRMLIQHGDAGCCVTDIQKEIDCAASTLSHHLETLSRFGLINSRKDAQWIFYSVNFDVLKELFNFLWQDCCSRSSRLVTIRTGQ